MAALRYFLPLLNSIIAEAGLLRSCPGLAQHSGCGTSVIARSVSDEAIQMDTAALDWFAFGSQ
jgi:hypothetical protein